MTRIRLAPIAALTFLLMLGLITFSQRVAATPDDPTNAPTPCDGLAFKVTLLGGSTVLGTQSGTISGNTGSASFTADAASVTTVAVVITG